MTVLSPGKYAGLRRLADESGRFKMLAVDQRPPIEELVRAGRGVDLAPFEDVARLKETLIRSLSPHASASLLDPQYAYPSTLPAVPRDAGLILTLEHDHFEETAGGRKSHPIPDWSVEKILSSGGDAVKVLAWYRPDADPEVREHQQHFVEAIGTECRRCDIPFVFELLVYPLPGERGHTTDYVEHPSKRTDHVLASVETFADDRFGVDLFKLESPVPAAEFRTSEGLGDPDVGEAFRDLDRAAGRPWVMLSAGADPASFRMILEHAFASGASGYLAGRAIWWEACKATFPDWDAMGRVLRQDAVTYMEEINTLTDLAALPWHQHRCFGTDGPRLPEAGDEFRAGYLHESR